MANKSSPLLPATTKLLTQFGEQLRLARLRRHLTAKQVAERAGMAPMTLRNVERGSAGVTLGAYVAVMQVLGIAQDITLLAKADETGRGLQDARLTPLRSTRKADATNPPAIKLQPKPSTKPPATSTQKFGASYISSDDLSALIVAPALRQRKNTK
jgi:transcriptional regulator with XRE-family HTH domain